MSISTRALVVLAIITSSVLAQTPAKKPVSVKPVTPAPQTVPPPTIAMPAPTRLPAERFSSRSLLGHVSFLASDALEGRSSPSRGLDIAAEYIAAEFRKLGLETVAEDRYFQNATMPVTEHTTEGWDLRFEYNGTKVDIPPTMVTTTLSKGYMLPETGVVKVPLTDEAFLNSLTAAQMRGKAIITELPDPRKDPAAMKLIPLLRRKLSEWSPEAVFILDRQQRGGRGLDALRLATDRQRRAEIYLHGSAVASFYDALPAGPSEAITIFYSGSPKEQQVKLRNIIGVLRGSDPVLRDTYVFLTAHYDHVGMLAGGDGDKIFNGANDDASGVAGVLEAAAALSSVQPRPKRSIAFVLFFGEEDGLIGAKYYAEHPVLPIAKTVAMINLEQIGRTDDSEGPQIASLSLTGFDYSDIGAVIQQAGLRTGVRVWKHATNSDAFFTRADNAPFAKLGIPAHTAGVSFMFPDYHGLGDEWVKLDYPNMAKITRTVATAVLAIADSRVIPQWNAGNPKAAEFIRAANQRDTPVSKRPPDIPKFPVPKASLTITGTGRSAP